jgi:hypothetical protein
MTSYDCIANCTWTSHQLLDHIAKLFPSKVTRNVDFKKSTIYFIHLRVLGKSWLGGEDVSDFMLYADIQL